MNKNFINSCKIKKKNIMKKIRFILYAFILGIFFVSCNKKEDNIFAIYNERISLSNDYSESTLVFNAIKSSPFKELKDSVNNWIVENLAEEENVGKFKGNKDSLSQIAHYYAKTKLAENLSKEEKDFLQEMNFKYFCFDSITIYPNKGLTSVLLFTETFMGGAHPNAFIRNATFDNETGHIYDLMEIINDTIELKKMIIQGIKKYFAVGADEELKEMLLMATVDNFPLPQQLPYFTDYELVIQYQSYEIAPYSEGNPYAVIPLEDCEKILRPEILKKVQSK